jgi:hypothetical protein
LKIIETVRVIWGGARGVIICVQVDQVACVWCGIVLVGNIFELFVLYGLDSFCNFERFLETLKEHGLDAGTIETILFARIAEFLMRTSKRW